MAAQIKSTVCFVTEQKCCTVSSSEALLVELLALGDIDQATHLDKHTF